MIALLPRGHRPSMTTSNHRRLLLVFAFPAALALGLPVFLRLAAAEEPQAVEFVPAKADEPLAPAFSLKLAAQSLDSTARQWQKENKFRGDSCCHSHANFMYLIARPELAEILHAPPDARALVEQRVG